MRKKLVSLLVTFSFTLAVILPTLTPPIDIDKQPGEISTLSSTHGFGSGT